MFCILWWMTNSCPIFIKALLVHSTTDNHCYIKQCRWWVHLQFFIIKVQIIFGEIWVLLVELNQTHAKLKPFQQHLYSSFSPGFYKNNFYTSLICISYSNAHANAEVRIQYLCPLFQLSPHYSTWRKYRSCKKREKPVALVLYENRFNPNANLLVLISS